VDVLAGPGATIHFPKQVEQARVHPGWFVAAPIAQKPVYLLETGRDITTILLVGDGGPFFGVQEIEFQRPSFGSGRAGDENAKQRGDKHRHAVMTHPRPFTQSL